MKTTLKLIFLILIIGCTNSEKKDGIRFQKANEHNIDATQLAAAYDNIAQIVGIKSLVVSRNEIMLSEEYFNGGSSQPDEVLDDN